MLSNDLKTRWHLPATFNSSKPKLTSLTLFNWSTGLKISKGSQIGEGKWGLDCVCTSPLHIHSQFTKAKRCDITSFQNEKRQINLFALVKLWRQPATHVYEMFFSTNWILIKKMALFFLVIHTQTSLRKNKKPSKQAVTLNFFWSPDVSHWWVMRLRHKMFGSTFHKTRQGRFSLFWNGRLHLYLE